MRLFFYLQHFPPNGKPLIQGVTKAINGLAFGCMRAGAKVTIICEADHRGSKVSEAGYDIECFHKQHKSRIFYISKEMTSWIKNHNVDALFILNGIFNPRLTAMKRILQKLGIPYIIATHSDYHPRMFRRNALRKYVYWYAFEKPMLQSAAAIQILDQRHETNLIRRGVNCPIIVSPNGCFPVDLQSDSSPAGSKIKMLFFGRLDIYNKGIDLLLGAMQNVSRRHDIDLTMQGPEHGTKDRIDRLILESGLFERVRCSPPEYDLPPSDVMSQYDMVLMPSRYEGFGLSALEAMLAERVLLVTREAGIAPHVEKAGCGVTIDPTINGIVMGLEDLIARRDDWKSMGQSGMRYALTELTWEKIGEDTLSSYRSILGSR